MWSPIMWLFIAYSIKKLSNKFKSIGGCCSTCLDYLSEVLWECKVRLTEDSDEHFEDMAAVINYITGGPDRGDVPFDAYRDYTNELKYIREERCFEEEQVSNISDNSETERCPICLADFENDVSIMQLKCSHFYHSTCATSWFLNNWICPMCRADIRNPVERRHPSGLATYWLF